MTIRLKFHILVLLVVLLTFSSHSVFGKVPSPTKSKVERKHSRAEAQAKLDAGADLNKPLWIGTGCVVPTLPTLGLLAGSLVPQSSSGGSGGYQLISFSDQQVLGICVGWTFGCLGPLTLIGTYQPTPSPERFIGKSPEYIAVYTDVYKTRTQWLRGQYIAVGCVIGVGLTSFSGEIYDKLTNSR